MRKTPGIRAYLIVSHSLLLVISLGVIGFIWSRNEYQVITREMQMSMRDRAVLLARRVSHEIVEHDRIMQDSDEYVPFQLEENLAAVYIDNSGSLVELVPGTLDPGQRDVVLQLSDEYSLDRSSFAALVQTQPEINNVYAAAPVFNAENQIIGKVCLLLPLADLEAHIVRMRWMLLGGMLIVALLGLGISTLLANFFSRQFSHAQGLAATVAGGHYQLRIPESGPAELRDLSHYLNIMAEKLEQQLKTRRKLLANVTHELARPLAGLQLGIESLRKGAFQDPNLSDDLLVNMERSIDRLKGRIEDLTLAAQPATQPIQLYCTAVAVEPFLKGTATYFGTVADSHGIQLDVQVDSDLPLIYADEKRLHQIMGNLVDNAIKFTPPGQIIQLTAERADEYHVRLMVHDGGEGMSPWEVEHIFEPFFQGDTGRRIKQGMGLGLSIARQLAQAHEGSLTLENHPEGGMLATLTLPIVET